MDDEGRKSRRKCAPRTGRVGRGSAGGVPGDAEAATERHVLGWAPAFQFIPPMCTGFSCRRDPLVVQHIKNTLCNLMITGRAAGRGCFICDACLYFCREIQPRPSPTIPTPLAGPRVVASSKRPRWWPRAQRRRRRGSKCVWLSRSAPMPRGAVRRKATVRPRH